VEFHVGINLDKVTLQGRNTHRIWSMHWVLSVEQITCNTPTGDLSWYKTLPMWAHISSHPCLPCAR